MRQSPGGFRYVYRGVYTSGPRQGEERASRHGLWDFMGLIGESNMVGWKQCPIHGHFKRKTWNIMELNGVFSTAMFDFQRVSHLGKILLREWQCCV